MNLLRQKNQYLNMYGNLLDFPTNWPFENNNTFIPNPEFYKKLEEYWYNYINQFNSATFQNGNLNSNPIEIHPYLNHPQYKFDKNKKRVILGTFPPFSYVVSPLTPPALYQLLNNNGIERLEIIYNKLYNQIQPNIHFFYGNIGSFWDYVPNNPHPLNIESCINWLNTFDSTISDIVHCCQRDVLNSPSDNNLINIIPNYSLIEDIINSENIDTILFTSGSPSIGYLGNNNSSTFSLFFRTLNEMGVTYKFSLFSNSPTLSVANQNINLVLNKAIFNVRLKYKEKVKNLIIVCLPSPSGQASRRMRLHPFFNKWSLDNPQQPGFTLLFRRYIYNLAFNNDFVALNQLQ